MIFYASFGFACQSCCVCLFTYGCLIFVVDLCIVFVFVCVEQGFVQGVGWFVNLVANRSLSKVVC